MSKIQKIGLCICIISIFMYLLVLYDLILISITRGEFDAVYRQSNYWYFHANHCLYFYPLKTTINIITICNILTGFGTGLMYRKIPDNTINTIPTDQIRITQKIVIPLPYKIKNHDIDIIRLFFNTILFFIITIYLLKRAIADALFNQSTFKSESILVFIYILLILIVPLYGINYIIKKILVMNSIKDLITTEDGITYIFFLVIFAIYHYVTRIQLLTPTVCM